MKVSGQLTFDGWQWVEFDKFRDMGNYELRSSLKAHCQKSPSNLDEGHSWLCMTIKQIAEALQSRPYNLEQSRPYNQQTQVGLKAYKKALANVLPHARCSSWPMHRSFDIGENTSDAGFWKINN
jgi:hypothetical protein